MLEQSVGKAESPPEQRPAPPILAHIHAYPDFKSEIESRRRRNRGLPDTPRPQITVPALADFKLPGECFRSDWNNFDQVLKAVTGKFISYDSAQHTQTLRMWEKLSSRCRTMPGGVMLLSLLANPPADAASAAAHREALEALRPGKPFRIAVDAMFQKLDKVDLWGRNRIDAAADLVSHEVMAPNAIPKSFWHGLKLAIQSARKYALFYAECRNGLREIIERFAQLPEAPSPLLGTLVEKVAKLKEDPSFSLLTSPLYRVGKSVETKPGGLLGWFNGHRVGGLDLQGKGLLGAGFMLAKTLYANYAIGADGSESELVTKTASLDNGDKLVGLLLTLPFTLGPIATFAWLNHRNKKFSRQVFPEYRDRVAASNLTSAYSHLGYLEALRTLADLREDLLSKGWKDPTIIDRDRYYASFSGMRNPFKELTAPGSTVPNDFELRAGSIASLSGPNSGGKTTLGLSIYWNTVLGQIGLPVACDGATYSCIEDAFYQGPQFSGLNEEGRFGFEMEKMATVLMKAGPRSLVIVDEIAGATSQNSGRRISARILWGLSKFDPGIMLITHDFNYARRLEQIGLATNFHFGWKDDCPTYKLEHGVSTSSQADAVARRVGVDRISVQKLVRTRPRNVRCNGNSLPH